MSTERPRYRSASSDSSRWNGFAHRAGDIVVDTPPKSGTTWMQMCCLVLVHDTPELPDRLSTMSPWVDTVLAPVEEARALLAAQSHRRVMKTHTPLDGVPIDERVTYVCVARDPRDALFSMHDHRENTDLESFQAARVAGLGEAEAASGTFVPAPDDRVGAFLVWVDGDVVGRGGTGSLRGYLHHVQTFWDRRDDPNVELFHYADMVDDPDRELRRLASVLDITIDQARWQKLVAATDIEAMRKHADTTAPGGGHWIDPARFFRRGGVDRWRDEIDEREVVRYEQRVAEIVDEELATWVHGGWRTLR